MTKEHARLNEEGRSWDKWGPYVSERQWGTVREDYSQDGNAWNYFPHDQARARAYRWGEDGIAGYCDQFGLLNLSLALWNGKDPILKERLFGLTNEEGNHGEDVKELYYYLDALPSHAYLKFLYKYVQGAYPYEDLIQKNEVGQDQREYELLDTGLFDEKRYFDVVVEYVKLSPDETLMRVTVTNRGPDDAPLTVMPQVTARNRWDWQVGRSRAHFNQIDENAAQLCVPGLHDYVLRIHSHVPELLFTENETNTQKIYGTPNRTAYVKDAFHRYIIHNEKDAVNPEKLGSKVGASVNLMIPAGQTVTVNLSLLPHSVPPFTGSFDEVFAMRKLEADEFYNAVQRSTDAALRHVQRQAFAGQIWSKQFYRFDVMQWVEGTALQVVPAGRDRNTKWKHIALNDIFLMPDKWEYPWFAAWDLAFHTISYSLIDPWFAKSQLLLLMQERAVHPNGQLPAYEWAFGDVNPPLHAWAAHRVFAIERRTTGTGDYDFLEKVFQKLLLNFTWWVNRKDDEANNLFEGGFLGLDNIGVFDRNKPMPDGMILEQADGTSWMAAYCLSMLGIAIELTRARPVYEDVACKFLDHFFVIASAANQNGLWDEQDGYYYDWVREKNGRRYPVRVRSVSGLVPLFAIAVFEKDDLRIMPKVLERYRWFQAHRPEMIRDLTSFGTETPVGRHYVSLIPPKRLTRVLSRLLDPGEFLAERGIRSLSAAHREHSVHFAVQGEEHVITYEPGESKTKIFGGNSNWRGPIWFPMNYLIIEALQKYHYALGNDFKINDPTGSSHNLNLWQVAQDISQRLISMFLENENKRPIHRHTVYSDDATWHDLLLFHEYFNPDTGEGLGASHQTGWTALVAKLIDQIEVEPSA